MHSKPVDIVLCGSGPAARDLFIDARNLARAQRVAHAWSPTHLRLEYADRIVEWMPARTAIVHVRGMQVRDVHVDAGVPADALAPDPPGLLDVIGAVRAAQLADGGRDWTWGDRQTQQAVEGRRGDAPAAAEAQGR